MECDRRTNPASTTEHAERGPRAKDTVRYAQSCEKPLGGFTAVPELSLQYLEDIYAGASILHLTGRRPSYPQATREMVLHLQNNNGGFRRSLELGLSGFEETYMAMRILQIIGYV